MIYPELHEELLRVHEVLAARENLSSQMISCAAKVEKDFGSACIMAIASLGGLHAPIEQTMKLLSGPSAIRTAEVLLQDGSKVPGWGSSFVKGEKDPIFDELDYIMYKPGNHTKFGTLWHHIADITDTLRSKNIFPNAACYTAAACLLNDIPPCIAIKVLIQGRIEAWSEIYLDNYNPRLR
jgi:hypothetical protein